METPQFKRRYALGLLALLLTAGCTASGEKAIEPTVPVSTEASSLVSGESDCPGSNSFEQQKRSFSSKPKACLAPGVSYQAVIETNYGSLTADLYSDSAPVTVNNFVFLAKYGYFNETICHRAIPGFVVQCGDPTGRGDGGPGYAIPDELPQAGSYKIGSLAMANAGSGTGGSQFFIVSGAAGTSLPPNYALFGQVTQGVEDVLTKLDAQGNPEQSSNGVPPLSEIRILSVKILEK